MVVVDLTSEICESTLGAGFNLVSENRSEPATTASAQECGGESATLASSQAHGEPTTSATTAALTFGPDASAICDEPVTLAGAAQFGHSVADGTFESTSSNNGTHYFAGVCGCGKQSAQQCLDCLSLPSVIAAPSPDSVCAPVSVSPPEPLVATENGAAEEVPVAAEEEEQPVVAIPAGKIAACDHPKYSKYYKMLGIMKSTEMVQAKMMADGVDLGLFDLGDPSALVDLEPAVPPTDAAATEEQVTVREHIDYAPHFAAFDGDEIPVSLRMRMMKAGLDPELLKTPDKLIPKAPKVTTLSTVSTDEAPVAAATPLVVPPKISVKKIEGAKCE